MWIPHPELPRPTRLIALAALALVASTADVSAQPRAAPTIAPGHEGEIADVLLGPLAERAGRSYVIDSVRIVSSGIFMDLSVPPGTLAVQPLRSGLLATVQTRSFDLLWTPADGVAPPPAELLEGIRARDPGDFWARIAAPPPPAELPAGTRLLGALRDVDAATLRTLLGSDAGPWPELPGRSELIAAELLPNHARLTWRLAGEVPVSLELHAREAGKPAVRELPSFRAVNGGGPGWLRMELVPLREEALEELYQRIEASDGADLSLSAKPEPTPLTPALGQGPDRGRVSRGWFLALAWLGLLAFLSPLLAPLLAPVRPLVAAPESGARNRAGLVAAALGALVVAVAWIARIRTGSELQLDAEHESFFTLAALCDAGLGCPAVGQPMGSLAVPLGPLFFQLLVIAGRFVSGPEGLFLLVGVAHALAAGLLGLLVCRLCGLPFGLLAGALLGLSPALLALESTPTHAALAPLPLVGLAWAGLSWLQGGGGRPFVLGALALGVALQLHGITGLSAIGLFVAAVLVRPATPVWAVVSGLAGGGLLFATWLAHAIATDLAWLDASSSPQLYAVGQPASLELLLRLLGPESWALVLAGLVVAAVLLVRSRDPSHRAVAWPVLLLVAVPLVVAVVARARWNDRYVVAFVPGLALCAGLGAWGAWQLFARVRSNGGRVLGLAAPVLLLVPLAWPARTLLEPLPSTWPLPLGVQRAVASAIDRHGHFPAALETRVHGELWNRADVAPSLIAAARDHSPAASPPPLEPGEHVLVVDGCRQLPRRFVRWQEAVEVDGRALVVAGYVPELAVPRLSVETPAGRKVEAETTLPIYEFDGNSWHRGPLTRLRPELAPALTRRPLIAALREGAGTTLVAETSLAEGSEDRVLAVRSAPGEKITLSIGGAVRPPDSTSQRTRTMTTRWRVSASERAARLPVVLRVERGSGAPGFELDLFEEPATCEKPAGPSPKS